MRSSPPREVETRLLQVAKQGVEKVLHPHRHAQENLIEFPCCGESKLRKNQVLESSTESTRRLRQQHIPPKPCILPRGKTGALQQLALTVGNRLESKALFGRPWGGVISNRSRYSFQRSSDGISCPFNHDLQRERHGLPLSFITS